MRRHARLWDISRAVALAASLASASCFSRGKHGDRDVPNLQQVSEHVYRGGQPTRAGFQRLQSMGVRTIASVRTSDVDSPRLRGLDLNYEHRPMSPWRPRDADVAWFLRLAAGPRHTPLYLHCEHGSDRTGWLIAMYRVVVEGWERERAVAEMTAAGNGFHDVYQVLIDYVREADIEGLRTLIAE